MKNGVIQQRGSAVVIVLAFLLLITVLAVGLMETIRTEHVSADSHLEGLQAEFYAQAAVDRVVGALQMQTAPQQSGTDMVYNWISQPGQLVVSSSSANGQLSGTVELSSGAADTALLTDARTYLRPPNLNVSTFRDSTSYLITEHTDTSGNVAQMPVAWLYVRKDGTLDTASAPVLTNTANPIVGRYAYWTDDESSKINLNLAWGRTGNTSPLGDPSLIDLTALKPVGFGAGASAFTQPWADTLHQYITPPRFYNSPEDVRVISGTNQTFAKALETYKFETTHYNSDPDTTFFNEKRIVLTTQLAHVPVTASGTAPFLDILATPNSDPGAMSSIDATKLNTVLNMLIAPGTGYLTRTDWPMAPGSSFQQKYYSGIPNRLTQLALNIIDYVRSKESTLPVIDPLRVELNNAGLSNQSFSIATATDANGYFGTARVPCITEIGLYVPPACASVSDSNYYPIVKVEVYSPANYNIPSVDLSKYTLNTIICKPGSPDYSTQEECLLTSSEVSTTNLTPGNYAVITHVFGSRTSINSTTTAGSAFGDRTALIGTGTLKIRVAITPPGRSRADIAPLNTSTAELIPLVIDTPKPSTSANWGKITSVEVDDPRVNKCANDWKVHSSGNTFGAAPGNPPSTLGLSGTFSPQQDTDASGHISKASFYMPPPKGSTGTLNDTAAVDNTQGVVTSVGELGFIHTGVQSAVNDTVTSGVPWRTLRLQPNSGANGVVPDWALMDLFTVPVVSSTDSREALSHPNNTSYGGRVNINSHLRPFDAAPYNMQRILPLAAVFQGCAYDSGVSDALTSASAQAIATAIVTGSVAASGTLYNFPNGYYSPGEIAEIAGVADKGESSEELVRQVSNLITARGNIFTIYSVGEAVKQTPDGRLVTVGQRRLQSMIERYVDPATGDVRFRTIYYRNLSL